MSNPINGVSGAGGTAAPKNTEPAAQKVNKVAESAGAHRRDDSVSLTSTAETLKVLRQEAGEGAPIDRQKVEAIKSALAAGNYELDAERVAQKFLEIEKALGKL